MKLTFPSPGEVIRYSYLWFEEQAKGHEEGSKDRPCLVVVANPDTKRVWVLPITHVWPGTLPHAEKIHPATKSRLALDEQESWIILSELNEFIWPGPDLRPVPGKSPTTCSYGLLPSALYNKIRDRLKMLIKTAHAKTVNRTE